jgi:hypothetical protein
MAFDVVRAEESDEDAALSAKQVRTALVLHEDSFLSEGFVALAPRDDNLRPFRDRCEQRVRIVER